MKVQRAWLMAFSLSLAAGPLTADEWVCLEAETFKRVDADCRNFGGVTGVVFPKKESAISTSINLPKGATTEIWARVYFPWAGQDELALKIGDREFNLSAKTTTGGGRWDVGELPGVALDPSRSHSARCGQTRVDFGACRSSGQRVDRVVLYWGKRPDTACSWLAVDGDSPNPVGEWDQAGSLVVPAVDFTELEGGVETLGKHKVAVLRGDADRVVTVFRTRKSVRASVWARVYFEAKNMYGGLTMQEMAGNLYVSVDGQLLKTVYSKTPGTGTGSRLTNLSNSHPACIASPYTNTGCR